MAKLSFRVVPRKNPLTDAIQYYAQKVTYTNIGMSEVCQAVSQNTGINPAVVKAAILAINDSVVNFVLNGHSVQVGDFMSLRPSAIAQGIPSIANANPPIKRFMLRCYWGNAIRYLQDPAHYELTKVP